MMLPQLKQNFWIVYYLSAISFGLLHIGNIKMTRDSPLSFVLVLPQIYGGLILGYLRLKFGIAESILVHMLNNTIATILFFCFGFS